MNAKLTGIRAATAAGGVALLMLVSACGGSGESTGEGTAEQDAGAGAAEETGGTDGGSDAGGESGAGEEQDGAGDGADADPSAGGAVAAPAEGFSACDVLEADELGEVTGLDLGEGTADEIMGSTTCTFTAADGSGMAMVQWAAVEIADDATFDATLEAAQSTYEGGSEAEQLDIPGASRAGGFTGDLMGYTAAGVLAQAEGGFLQVVVGGSDVTIDAAAEVAELTLARA
ncbi:hypothetical protein GCG21_12125 [Pseudactinotalea sp. HY160]|uniref:hypothetical protein n=1 Tax=Pseudactinotalea sp. HY160 TaxID=2654490 RepID=UPI00128E2270|nr:hypothetical protein [Pseudactinotalea sp. HY160]MPV50740.1 hypothetical protein [Pseudactinotalea sp. HY160]